MICCSSQHAVNGHLSIWWYKWRLAVRSVYSRRGRIKQSFRFQEGKPTYTTHTSTYFIYTHRLPLQPHVPAARLYCNYTTLSPTTALRFTFKFSFLQMRTHPPLSYFYRWEQPWDGILGQQFNRGLESFAPCCSQSLLYSINSSLRRLEFMPRNLD